MNPLARDLLHRLGSHHPIDGDETRALGTMIRFVTGTAEPFTRRTLEGHVTGSAVVMEPSGRALLLFHARLGIWVQPGGHVEEGERPDVAAHREATEESGLSDLVLTMDASGRPLILDVDVHPIPAHAGRGEPAHHHHDVCYLARTTRPAEARHDPNESRALRWVTSDETARLPLDPATRRRLEKAFRLA